MHADHWYYKEKFVCRLEGVIKITGITAIWVGWNRAEQRTERKGLKLHSSSHRTGQGKKCSCHCALAP